MEFPSVTLIVLNYNGQKLLEECFPSLVRLDYPAELLNLMLVDNASTDGSVEYIRTYYPQTQIVQTGENLGFAGGNNAGARAAHSQYIIFLNNDMFVHPAFGRELVKAVQSVPGAESAGAKIFNWDGSHIDFAGSASDFAAHAYQLGIYEPAEAAGYDRLEETLFACGGAMLIDREVFLDVGGFDEHHFIYYEDLDLGWRLWVMGYKVVYAPAALANHRHHGTMDSFSNYRKWVLYKRNALYTALKNYSDENLGRVFSTIMLSSVEGIVKDSVRAKRLDLDDFFIKSRQQTSNAPVLMDRQSAGTLVAMHDVIEHLPQVMERRRFVQQNRKRRDEEIAPLFRRPFRFWPDVEVRTQYPIAEIFGVQSLFQNIPRRVLVISSDILPFPGYPTVGSGLRAWGLGQGLKSRGHQVLFAMPKAALQGREDFTPKEVAELVWETHTLAEVIHKADPDVVVVCNWPIMDLLPAERVDVPLVLDQHGPHFLEREYNRFGDHDDNIRRKLNALRKADLFTCAGSRQLGYFQSWLERAGWSERERRELSAAIPVSLSPDLPALSPDPSSAAGGGESSSLHTAEGKSQGEVIFVYGGVFLPWQDPSNGLFALVETLNRRGGGRLDFYGGKHLIYPVDTGIFDQLLAELQQSPQVVVVGMIPHDELIERYTRSHVAIDVMARNPERELAFTTRTVEYLWCGLPVIYHDYAELSDYIRDYDAGWVVNPADRAGIVAVIEDILAHPEQVAEKSRNAQRLVQEKLTWDRTITPLDEFVRSPRVRNQHVAAPLSLPAVQQTARRLPGFMVNRFRLYYRVGGAKAILRAVANYLTRKWG